MLVKILWLGTPILEELEALRVIFVCNLARFVPLQVGIFANHVAVVELNVECVIKCLLVLPPFYPSYSLEGHSLSVLEALVVDLWTIQRPRGMDFA